MAVHLTLRARIVLAVLVPALGAGAALTVWALDQRAGAEQARDARERVEVIVAYTHVYDNVSFTREITDMVSYVGGLGNVPTNLAALARGQVTLAHANTLTEMERIRSVNGASPEIDASIDRVKEAYVQFLNFRSMDPGPSAVLTPRGRASVETFRNVLLSELNHLRSGTDSTYVAETAEMQILADYRSIALRESSLVTLTALQPDWTTPEVFPEIAVQLAHTKELVVNQLSPGIRQRFLAIDTGPNGRKYARLREQIVKRRAEPTLAAVVAVVAARDQDMATLEDSVGVNLSLETAAQEHIARRRFALGIWGALGLFVASLTLGLLSLRPTARTLRRLALHTNRIGAGDLNVEPIVVPGRDETAQLANAFNEMTGTLRTLQFQLDALGEGRTDDPVLNERVPGHIGQSMARSMHQLTQMTALLSSSEQTARLAIDTTVEAIWTLAADGTVLRANSASAGLLGRPVDSMLGRPIATLLGIGPFAMDADGGMAEVTDVDGTLSNNGDDIDVLISVRRVDLGEGARNTMVFARDISERKRFEDELAWKAGHDQLTGLPNRVALHSELAALSAACGEHDELAVMFIDLDRFKRVNDGMGHRFGDELLRQVAARLRANLRADDVLARLGGDEFVVARIAHGEGADVEPVGRRLIDALEVPFELDGGVAHISASVGIVVAGGEIDGSDIIRFADVAMYAAKQSGRGRVVRFDESMQGAVRARVEMEEGLRNAIGNDELWAAFQPVVATSDGSLAGVELLARWSLPGVGPISPGEFIPLAEETGVIVDIGIWALRCAAQSAVSFRGAIPGFDVSIAVNISSVHLMYGQLVDDVRNALLDFGAKPEWLRLEITESYLLDEGMDGVDETLHQLVDMGIKLSVDDFGTGYSSLTYLRRIPADVVKVDRSYVMALQHDNSAVAIIELVATLAHNLGMKVVAEGVETDVQRQIVLAAGCELSQGFHFARPMSGREFIRWAEERQRPQIPAMFSPVDSE
jgi:diguanylate cyclase (GGDEF)-like protein/PAS domain S-box-containing protein